MSHEAGRIISDARRRQGYSQARLADLAGISRRQLAAIEGGANTSLRVIERLSEVLAIPEIPLGATTIRLTPGAGLDLRVILDRVAGAEAAARNAAGAISHVRAAIESHQPSAPDRIADRDASVAMVRTAVVAEITIGKPLAWRQEPESVVIDRLRVTAGEIVMRFRSRAGEHDGLKSGDLIVLQVRPGGDATTGELVLVLLDGAAHIGRWWDKLGHRALHGSRSGRPIRSIPADEELVLVGAITDVIRAR